MATSPPRRGRTSVRSLVTAMSGGAPGARSSFNRLASASASARRSSPEVVRSSSSTSKRSTTGAGTVQRAAHDREDGEDVVAVDEHPGHPGALGPAVQVNGTLRGRITPARLDAILGDL